ncbi:MAG: cupredoxin family copper-binding protein [Alphaproteobacteria bacterium]
MYKPLLVAAALAASAPAAFGDDMAAIGTAPAVIVISNYEFNPAVLTVAPGTTVTWVNEDQSPHTIAEQTKAFRSPALDTSDRFSYTFAQPGEFAYYCTLHPMMVGKIVVKPAGASS